MKITIRLCLLLLVIISCEGPEGDVGPRGQKSLIKVEGEPGGSNCSNGGVKIENGVDLNDNNGLEDNEIQGTQYLCNGVDGAQGPVGSGGVNIIRIPIQVAFTWRHAGHAWSSEIKDQLLQKFNIADYPGFTKAFFIAQFDRTPDNTTDSLHLRLYDYKNSKKITNSEVTSTITNVEFNADHDKRVFQSIDIYNSFERKESTIGIQFRKQLSVSDYRGISIHGAEILLMK